jgi:AcrR family transcriptional regulator
MESSITMGKSILKQLKENEREVRRKLIIDAARSLYKHDAFHAIGMRDISNKAGISVASLYQYFPSQDDLFISLLKSELDAIRLRLWKDDHSLEDISIEIVDFLIDNDDIFLMLSHFMVKGDTNSDALEKFNQIRELFLDMLNAALANSVQGISHDLYSRAFFTALFGNVITFRNHYTGQAIPPKNTLYDIVRITARAFQEALNQSQETGDHQPIPRRKITPHPSSAPCLSRQMPVKRALPGC